MAAQEFSLVGKRVFVSDHRSMVGSAIARRLAGEPCDVLTAPRSALDLGDQAAVRAWFAREKPDAVFLSAEKAGGILAIDSYPANFLYENLMIAANVIEAAHRADVAKLLFLGSSTVYPRQARQPVAEDALLTGPLEAISEWYAMAKLTGIKLVQAYRRQHGRDYIAALPPNVYGPRDNFDLESSQVLPALIRKMHEAKRAGAAAVEIWGDGTPRREFLHVDDLADACVFLMNGYSGDAPINVGFGSDVTVLEVAEIVMDVVGYRGSIQRDFDKPDGRPRKLMSSAMLNGLGWSPTIGLRDGIADVYRWYIDTYERAPARAADER